MKYPWMQFYVNDWMTPNVGMCQPETRGIWIDWLCAMHSLDRCGQITGTREQLAALGRCTVVQVESTLTDLTNTKTADVTFRNDVVTVVNRRMKREYLSRKNGAIRVKLHRSNAACNAPVADISHISKSELRTPCGPPVRAAESQTIELPMGFPKTEEEAKKVADFVGCTPEFAALTWSKAMGRGGRDARDIPIRNWQYHLKTEANFGKNRIENQKYEHTNRRPSTSDRNAGTFNASQDVEAINRKIRGVAGV